MSVALSEPSPKAKVVVDEFANNVSTKIEISVICEYAGIINPVAVAVVSL